MRARDFLLEYDRSKTLQNWRTKLRGRVARDPTVFAEQDIMRAKNNYYTQFKAGGIPEETLLANDENIMKSLEWYDPTPNQGYVLWIVQRYISGGIRGWEDLPRTLAALTSFEQLKSSGFFKRKPSYASYADIGRFRSLSQLGEFIVKLDASDFMSVSKASNEEENRMIADGEAIVLADTAEIKVIVPRSHAAAMWWGRNTQWCTSMRGDARTFGHYTQQGPLYIVLEKKTNHRWQLHFETGQFMDETDEPIEDWRGFPKAAFGAIDFSKISNVGKYVSLTSTSGGELPIEIQQRIVALSNDGIISGALLETSVWSQATKCISDAAPGDPNFSIVFRKAKNGAGVEILDFRTDMLSFLRYNKQDLKQFGGEIRWAMGISGERCDSTGDMYDDEEPITLGTYLDAFRKTSHIISYRDERDSISHILVYNQTVTVINGVRENGLTKIVQHVTLENQLRSLRNNAESHFGIAMKYVLQKAEMYDDDAD